MNKIEFANQFYNYIKQLFKVNNRDTTGLYFKLNKSTCNIILKDYIFMQFKKPYEFWLKPSAQQLLNKYNIEYVISEKKYDTIPFKIVIDSFSFINENAEFLLELFDEIYLKCSSDAFFIL